MHIKKHLSFKSLRKSLSKQIESFPDARHEGKLSYSQHDALMSGFACMYFPRRGHYVARPIVATISTRNGRSTK